ncbi:MAG: hypothetical protein IPK82_00635 [Polyangiaceae bacterium]|nr:hypothetical protein [Polyangiaceae bacterium]
MRRALLGRLAKVAVFGALAVGCAEERDPISRVQANALSKRFFVGDNLDSTADDPEFYMRTTIIDVPYGSDGSGLFTSSYAQPVVRVKWEVTEKLLLARMTHETITDVDHHGSQRTNNGTVVAAYAITSHFDIRRAYNPSTGEETNVIEENTSDRAWHLREYFRVDWASNLVTDAYELDTLSMLGINDGVDFQPRQISITDPNHEDAPLFDAENGYFDVTNLVYASPRILDTPYGSYPACYFRPEFPGGTYPVGNCNPSEVKLRVSWRRVTDTDYEPKDWTYERFAAFGAFYEERRGWDDQYGVVDANWHRLGAFHNIWQRSHTEQECNVIETNPYSEDPHRDVNADGTEDECQVLDSATGAATNPSGAGSRCDPLVRKCTIPYAERNTKPVVWYLGPGQEEATGLWDTTAGLVGEWDMALRAAVQTGRLVECRRTNGASAGVADKAACDAKYPMDDASVTAAVSPIFVFCHNPVAAGDSEACGEEGKVARLGDLRYNFVNVIATPQSGSPWGIMVDGVDPLTGEKVQGSVNVWDSVNHAAAQGAVDVIRWMNGEISEEEIKSGAYINKYTITGDLKEKNFFEFRTMTKDDVKARLHGLTKVPLPNGEGSNTDAAALPAMSPQQLLKAGHAAYTSQFGPPVDTIGQLAAREQAAMGSGLEAQLTTGNWMELAGLDPHVELDQAGLSYASPFRGNDLAREVNDEHLHDHLLAQKGVCMVEAPEPTALVGLAKVMKDKFPLNPAATEAENHDRVVRMREYLRKKLYYGVMAHEMGHSVGLRHNFVGSYDALNFRPQYWQLRTNNGQVETYCDDQVADGSTCVGPRWHDPMTQDEIDGLLWMWQHTTVMDYPGDVSQDTLGLGPYDKAAARFFYTDTMEVWAEPGQECLDANSNGSCDNPVGGLILGKVDNYGGIGGPWAFKGNLTSDSLHYSQFQKELHLIRDCQPSNVTQPADWNEAENGVWSPVFDGHVVLGTECKTPPKDYGDFRDLESGRRIEKATGRVRWPHMFATDYSADIGNVAVLRHDNGADVYEQFSFLMSTYENRHIFDNFRRGRQAFSVRGAALRSLSRYNDKIRNIVQGFALWHDFILRGLNLETGQNYVAAYESWDGMLKPNALASSMAFDHFVRQLVRPQPGEHGRKALPTGQKVLMSTESLLNGTTSEVILPEGSQAFANGEYGFGARKVNNSLNNGDGSFDIQWLTGAGSYYDKVFATYHLTESSNRFLDVSLLDFVDGRYRNLSLVNLFPDGYRRLVASALTGDSWLLGPRLASSIADGPPLKNVDKMPARPIGWVSWWPEEGPEVCWPVNGSLVCRDLPTEDPLDQDSPPNSVAVDPQVGIEVQKWILYYSMLNLPENWKTDWVDQFRIYSVGSDTVPDLPTENAIWWKDPVSGTLYIARRHGTETIFGKTVEKGVAARMLAWANLLTSKAYEVDSVDPVTGKVNVVFENGEPKVKGGVKCEDSPDCIRMRNYKTVVDFARQTAGTFGFPAPEPIGVDF